jgi:pimeloyl-ACP methyl ester carboxylesterase
VTEPPTLIAQTALGPVQYATAGEGPAVLTIHGSPGGSDAGLLMGRFLAAAGCRVIAPSRPGYLGTPLGIGGTIDSQADLHAALLDALGVERAGVLSWSGGGPSGYRLAVRHPDRVRGLVAFAAVSTTYPRQQESRSDRFMFTTRPGAWLARTLTARSPERAIASMMASEGDLAPEQVEACTRQIMADEGKVRFLLDVAGTVYRGPERKPGYENDLAGFAAITSLELERIAVPTLVVHGAVDSDVRLDHGTHAAATIPGAELLTLERGTHFALFTHPDAAAAQARALELLR